MCSEQSEGKYQGFFALLISAFFIYTYNNIFMVVTPVLLVRMGGTDMIVGLQSTLFLVTAVILRFFFGPLADMYGRRFVMILGSVSFLLAAVMLFYAAEIWQIIVLRLVQAIGLASYFPAASATAATFAGNGQKGTYIGALRVVASLSLMFGPAFAFNFIQNRSLPLFFRCMVLLVLLGMVPIFFISLREDKMPQEKVRNGINLSQRLNLKLFFQKCPLIIGNTFVAALSYGIYMSFATLFINCNSNILNPGYFFTLFSIGGIIGNIGFGWLSDHFGRLRITFCTFLSLGSGIILFSILPQASVFFYPAGLFSGAGYFGSIAVLMAWMTEKAESSNRTTALSLQQNALDFGIAIGSGVFGILLVAVNNTALVYGALGVLYLCYAFFMFSLRRN
ncbi:MFS transporter [Desulfitobacterium sp. AusDCA]|uniref:MFS transporter n=1 Tax=Desulfitobacterium sp. AusDCA TaxID=3240383 RepID=UPI003DA76A2D